jgi:uncharacterized delta-60 repeat protein
MNSTSTNLLRRQTWRLAPWLAGLALAACGGGGPTEEPLPTKPVVENITRDWHFTVGFPERNDGRGNRQGFGVLSETRLFGPQLRITPDSPPDALGEIYSSMSGETYSLRVDSPHAGTQNQGATAADAVLRQNMYYRKTAPNARLTLHVTGTLIEGLSRNAYDPVANCPASAPHRDSCRWLDLGEIRFQLGAYNITRQEPFWARTSSVQLFGWQANWDWDVNVLHYGNDFGADAPSVFTRDDFVFDPDADADGGLHAVLRLARPLAVSVPLDRVAVGEEFSVAMQAVVQAVNGMQGESVFWSYFRDPVSGEGVGISYEGLEPIAVPTIEPPWPSQPLPPECTSGVDPLAGTLQFGAAAVDAIEQGSVPVQVLRAGGSKGRVSVTLGTADGSATAGADYQGGTTTIAFEDGEEGSRVIRLPITADALIEGNETFTVSLTDVRGCAALGDPSTTTVTIIDDDLATARYSVGGTVTGLTGSGLVLSNNGGDTILPDNGTFTFPTELLNGKHYDVQVAAQPANPLQVCTVTQGSGTIQGADVASVRVDCAAPQPNGALDTSFGSGGLVTNSSVRDARSMALQPDGKLVVLSDSQSLTRYNADGSPDLGFGTGGIAKAWFTTDADTARGIALQPDGRIVVVGLARVGSTFDFGAARFNADGSLDTTFGTAGRTAVDVDGPFDEARVPLIRGDGKILVVGNGGATAGAGADSNFAVVRLEATGAVDTSFGSGGKVSINIAGRADLASSALLQSDGRIVVAGRVGADGGAAPDVGLVRVNANGMPDTSFGAAGTGIVRIDWSGNGDADEATGLALQADGKIVVAALVRIGGVYRHALGRLNADGTTDMGFGSGGLATQSFAAGGDFARALAVQADGRIVTAGSTRPGTSQSDDFLVTRHNADGSLDTSFGNGGAVVFDYFATADGAECLAIQPDGRIVAAGLATSGSTPVLAIARLLP